MFRYVLQRACYIEGVETAAVGLSTIVGPGPNWHAGDQNRRRGTRVHPRQTKEISRVRRGLRTVRWLL